jgi:hypothetical protein
VTNQREKMDLLGATVPAGRFVMPLPVAALRRALHLQSRLVRYNAPGGVGVSMTAGVQ